MHFLLLLLLGSVSGQAEKISPETYSEWVNLDEKGDSVDLNFKLLWRNSSNLIPYGGYSYLRYSAYDSVLRRHSPMLGLRWQPLSWLRLYGEYRLAYDSPDSPLKRDDPRLGAVLFYFQDILNRGSIRLISESYGEIIHMNRYSNSPLLSGWTKLGPRWNPTPHTYIDIYGEAYGLEARDPLLGRRAQELRLGARLGWAMQNFGFSAQVFRRFASFVEAPKARVRFLLAFGGYL